MGEGKIKAQELTILDDVYESTRRENFQSGFKMKPMQFTHHVSLLKTDQKQL